MGWALPFWLAGRSVSGLRRPAEPGFCLAAALVLVAAGCADKQPVGALQLPDASFGADGFAGPDGAGAKADAPSDAAKVPAADAQATDASTEVGPVTDAAAPANQPPAFVVSKPIQLKQGTSTQVDLAAGLADDHDSAAQLKLSWSAQHVALKDSPAHNLYVVAPTTWFGTEQIVLTATDSGGLQASATLTVVVVEVPAPKPTPNSSCGEVTFSIGAGKGQHEVLLSGTFNGWAATAGKADVLTDPAGTGTWTLTKKLEPGVYQYKFIVDGKWMADAANPNQTPDGFGGMNSVIEVSPCTP